MLLQMLAPTAGTTAPLEMSADWPRQEKLTMESGDSGRKKHRRKKWGERELKLEEKELK
jgi:hypothetical protein